MNLISNAVEAMTGTSKSKAGWKTGETIDGEITVNSDLGKDTITINVADTGPGISEEDNHDKILDIVGRRRSSYYRRDR